MSSDAFHITGPSEDGEVCAHEECFARRNLAVSEVDDNAHGTSTPLGDVETMAIKEVFGQTQIYLSAAQSRWLGIFLCCGFGRGDI